MILRQAQDKFKLVLVLALMMLFACSSVFAQTGTGSATVEDKEIQDFKEKVATKVAELREKNNRAISGFVTRVSGLSLTIKDENDVEYEVKPDEALAKYYQVVGNQRKEIKFNDIAKDTFIIAMGVLSDKVMNANTVYVDEMFLVKAGKITEVDNSNFALKVLSSDKDNYTLEIETTTRQDMINAKTLEVERAGFSKIKAGDTIHFVVKKTENPPAGGNTFTAIKVLIIPQEYFMK